MTPCQRLKQNLFDLLDADVENHERKRMEGHFKTCPHCFDFYRKLKRQKNFLKGLKPIRTEDHFIILLRDRIRREIAGKAGSSNRAAWFSWKWAAGFASIVLIAAALFRFSNARSLKNQTQTFLGVKQPVLSATIKPAVHSEQFVIDDFKGSTHRSAASPKQAASAGDTVQTDSSAFEELRSRLTPVSF
jgi:anti-sigma factor RsiW